MRGIYMDYTYLYSTRIQKTFDEDQADILSVLKSELDKKKKLEVHLINYYKGMPVSFKAQLVDIDKDALDLDISPQQAVAISSEHYTFIRSKLFKHDILAKAQYVNIRRKAVSLRKLCYVEIMAERRNHLRLILEPPINAIFNSAAGVVTGKIVELSMAGARMVVEQPCDEVLGQEAKLSMMMSDIGQDTSFNITLPAKVVSISDDIKPMQLMLLITPDLLSDRLISKYLIQRQIEIIREIKDASGLD